MLDRILINPESRFLGSSAANDFSLYGAQPPAAVAIRAADDAPLADAGDDSRVAGSGSPADDGGAPFPSQTFASADTVAEGFGSPLFALPAIARPGEIAEASRAEAVAGTSSGAAVSDFPGEVAGSGAPATSSLTPAPAAEAAPVGTAASEGDMAAPAAPVHAMSLTPDAVSALLLATPVIDQATDALVADPSPTISAAVAPLDLLPATEATGPVIDAAADVPEAVTGTLAAALPAEAPDALDDLAGSDPAAGIATLVSLVSVPDVLAVPAAGAPDVAAAADSGADMLDTLAADTIEVTLPAHDTSDGDEAVGDDAPAVPADDPLDDPIDETVDALADLDAGPAPGTALPMDASGESAAAPLPFVATAELPPLSPPPPPAGDDDLPGI
jgi:hypothetical protein